MVNFNAVSQYAGRLFKAVTVLGVSVSLLMSTELVNAQSVGISGTTITPSPNSLLEIRSSTTSRGLLIPRVLQTERITLGNTLALSPLGNVNALDTERGMLVFQREAAGDPMGYYFWNGTAWVRLMDAGSATGWLTSGNVATGAHFLGTTNNEPLRIHTNGILRYSISASTGSLLAHQNGTAAAPVFTWNGDENMGIYRITDDVLGFSTAGAQRLRIAADGNVGIGVLATDPVIEKLQVTGNAVFTTGANRVLSVQDGPTASAPGYNLEIRAGSAFPDLVEGAAGGDLILKAGSANAALAQHQGDVRIISGGNTHGSGGGADGNIILLSGPVAPSVTPVERMRIFNSGVVRINSLGGSGDRLVQTNNAGEISIGPALSSFGTVTNIATGTGLTGGPITSTGTISMADMAALSVKGNATNASAPPTDIAAGTDHQVLRRSGTALGFGAVNLASANAVTGILPVANGGTGSGSQNWVDLTTAQTAAGIKTWSDQANFSNVLRASAGTAAAPSYSFTASPATGMYLAGINELAFSTNSTERIRVSLGGTIRLVAYTTDGIVRATGGNGTLTSNGGGISLTTEVTGILPVANGGTGSGSQNWVDLTTVQTAAGAKTWSDLGTFNTGVRVANGSAAAPTVTFAGSTTSGLYQQAANAVGVATAGVERVRVTNLGMGILGGVPTATQALVVVGKVKSTGINETSDGRLKKNVAPISNGLEKILSMSGVTYDWRRDEFPDRNFLAGKQYGLIAQELEKVIPELVDTDEEGWKSIEYSHIVPVLIEAIKEQQAIIAGQQQEITSLQSMKDELNTLKASIELLNEHLKTSQK